MKKTLLVLLGIVIAGCIYLYFHGAQIFQVSAETVIKQKLPPYVSVADIIFDLKNNKLEVKYLSIDNPEGFHYKHLAEFESISCRYEMRGKTILDGIKITDVIAYRPRINIERLPDGKLNAAEMSEVMELEKPEEKENEQIKTASTFLRDKLSDIIELPEKINIKEGSLFIHDSGTSSRPFDLMVKDINGILKIKLTNDYKEVILVETTGVGFVDGDRTQSIQWVTSMDPRSEFLRMSNNIKVRGVKVKPFEVYYDKYSPIIIETGNVSGDLIFNFDRGEIGSSNVIALKDLRFQQKMDTDSSLFWQAVNLSDLIKYLQSNPGEVMLDFKIKGPMHEPKFYLGAHVKKALQAMAIDTIASFFTTSAEQKEQEKTEQDQEEPEKKNDVEKIAGFLKGLLQ